MKNNYLPTRQIFYSILCGQCYEDGMSEVKFQFLLNSLRFNDQMTRRPRKKIIIFYKNDTIMNESIWMCKYSYTPEVS